MLNFLKIFVILVCMNCAFVWFVVGCMLERNEFNKYPWLLKLVVNGSMLGPGMLLTPYKVISAATPFWPIVISHHPPDLSPIEFVGFNLKAKGVVHCSVTRQAVTLRTHDNDQDIMFWFFKKRFDTLHYPFIWTRTEDINSSKLRKTAHEIKDSEQCDLPVFETNSPKDAKMKLKPAFFLANGIKVDKWLQIHCDYNTTCMEMMKSQVFLAWDDGNHMPGQVIICRGLAIGTQRLKLSITSKSNDNATEEGPTMYDNFGCNAEIYLNWAVEEWPTEGNVTFRSPTRDNTHTPFAFENAITRGPTRRYALTTLEGSSRVPDAPTMTTHRSSTKTTKLFVRTLPKRARSLVNAANELSLAVLRIGVLVSMALHLL